MYLTEHATDLNLWNSYLVRSYERARKGEKLGGSVSYLQARIVLS